MQNLAIGKTYPCDLSKIQAVYIDQTLVDEYIQMLGLPKNHQKLAFARKLCTQRTCKLKGEHYHVRLTKPETAFLLGIPVWRRLNIVSKPCSRCTMYDVIGIINICFDFEYRSDPEVAKEVARHFVNKLIAHGFAPQEVSVIDSGGGVHVIINIKKIDVTRDTAKRWNTSIQRLVDQYIDPLFQEAKDFVSMLWGIDLEDMNIEAIDIARLLSGAGDYRPSTHVEDHTSLLNGFIRHSLDNKPLYRKEWPPMRNWIEKMYREIEDDPKEKLATMYKQEDTPSDNEIISVLEPEEEKRWRWRLYAQTNETTVDALRRKVVHRINFLASLNRIKYVKGAEKKPENYDRSKLVNRIVCYLCWFCHEWNFDHRKFVWTFRTAINECCGSKYANGNHLDGAIENYIRRWELLEKEKANEVFVNCDEDVFEQKPQIGAIVDQIPFILKFLNAMYDKEKEGCVLQSEFLSLYKEACDKWKEPPLTDQQVTRFLGLKGVKSIQNYDHGKKVRVYSGIKMKF